MIELSRLRGSERYAACSDDVMAHRPYGSAQTGMYPFALGDGGKQPADRMIANRRLQAEPRRSLCLRQTGQHSGVDRS